MGFAATALQKCFCFAITVYHFLVWVIFPFSDGLKSFHSGCVGSVHPLTLGRHTRLEGTFGTITAATAVMGLSVQATF